MVSSYKQFGLFFIILILPIRVLFGFSSSPLLLLSRRSCPTTTHNGQPTLFTLKRPSSVVLYAKKKKKVPKKKKTTGGGGGLGGGFGGGGATATASIKQKKQKSAFDDDYAVFPALERQVQETLVPADNYNKHGEADAVDGEENYHSELPMEIIGRVSQIYGFKHFNYIVSDEKGENGSGNKEEQSSPLSLEDLIMSPSSSSDNSIIDDHQDKRHHHQQEKGESNNNNKLPLSKLPHFDKCQVLHVDPLVLSVDDFFTSDECDRYVASVSPSGNNNNKQEVFRTQSKTVGKDALAKSQRTSTTWFHHYSAVPELMAKASRLLGLDGIEQWEEPQVVRYRRNEKFTWHLDALGPEQAKPELGGQRIATLLVYLTDLDAPEGGATMFRDLVPVAKGGDGHDDNNNNGRPTPLRVRPKKGSALLFFPSAGGIPGAPLDIRTLHCGEAVADKSSTDKWISQLWLREFKYSPTAPKGNKHSLAVPAISKYCSDNNSDE